MNDLNIKQRREALGLTQTELAEKVAKRSGRTFSQQSMAKLEANPNASSRFMHHLLAVLEDEESSPKRARLKRMLDQVPEGRLDVAEMAIKQLTGE